MRKLTFSNTVSTTLILLFLSVLMSLSAGCRGKNTEVIEVTSEVKEETAAVTEELIWHIKAVHPEGRFLDVKALDADGNIYDVKAIQDSDQRQLMDIKALMGSAKIPVKILVSTDEYAPVKAIGTDGTIYDIKALTPEGERLDVKGVSRAGNIIDIKAINNEGTFYGIKAISPTGQLNDVKGVKMFGNDREATVNGVDVHAHIKALPQAVRVGGTGIWHIKAIHPEGRTLDVKALDSEGNIYDVKAIQDAGQRQLMDVKALMEGKKAPVKILVSGDAYAPVKALGEDGTIYDIKALTPEGERLDVKGVKKSGNITHIKAINSKGEFYGIKAISPDGMLNDVKGVKMTETDQEAVINGVKVHAHIKALPQID
ncbi:MAG: hypothetical protein P8Z38_02250 [Robiginitalea sp.]